MSHTGGDRHETPVDHPSPWAWSSRSAVGAYRPDRTAPFGTGMHDLRHFSPALLIRHGESVKVVQARLVHATAAETLDTCSHLWPDSDDTTGTAVDSITRGGDSVGNVEIG
jgi:integrase